MEDQDLQTAKLVGIEYAAQTNVGMRREENQDAFGVIEKENLHLFIVADGMGGVKGGGIASKMAIEALTNRLSNRDSLDEAAIIAAVEYANQQIFQKGRSDLELVGMGTTLVGLAFVADQLYVVNVGDSRAYQLRGNEIIQLTDDHTLVMELVKSGALSIEQAQSSPCSHMLTRSLGPGPEVLVDCAIVNDPPVRNDFFLLCTDGLYNLVTEEEIYTVVNEFPVKDAVDKLINLANQRGGTDNITVVLIKMGEEYVRSQPEPLPVVQKMGRRVRSTAQRTESQGGSIASDSPDQSASEGIKQTTAVIEPRLSIDQLAQAQEDALARASEMEQLLRRASAAEKMEFRSTAGAAESFFSKPVSNRATFLVLAILFLVIGGLFGYIYSLDRPYLADLTQLPETAPSTKTTGLLDQGDLVKDDGTNASNPDISPSLSSLAILGSLTESERQSVIIREQGLRSLLARLEDQLLALSENKPLDPAASAEIISRVQLLQEEMSLVQSQLQTATRKLAIWYGRRSRLQSSNPLNLAAEIAVISESVRKHKTDFEAVTYEYLKNAEELKYDPANEILKQRVADLVQERRQHLQALNSEINAAVEQVIADVNKNIAELTLQRERVQSDLLDSLDQQRYQEILLGDDLEKRAHLESELRQKLEAANAELSELRSILTQDGGTY